MKTIKIFLASSEELSPEREKMADLVLHLNKLFKGRGIQLDLEKWEYLDASMSGKRKQDEYNDVLHQCDICMVLFWRRFGSYTGEELDVAYKSMLDGGKPQKIYVFFKSPNSEDVSQEVRDFITEYEKRYGGHFFCKFHTVDTMKLEFLLQLENYQKDMLGEKTIEVRNEHVFVDNEALVDLNNVPFAANNEGFKKRQAELKELEGEIEKKRKELDEKEAALQLAKDQQANLPGVAGLQMFVDMAQKAVNETEDSLQVLLNSKSQLMDEFEREQQNLFNTARRITEQRGQKISERMTRAIEAFESGDAQRADIILDEAEKDFEEARKDFRITKKVSVQALEEQIQRASYKMSNSSIPIEERIAKTLEIYKEADAFAQEIYYDQEKYIDFLWDYSDFLHDHAHYNIAIEILNKLIKMCEDFYGKEHLKTADSYNNIGIVYDNLGNYDKALEYYKKALRIRVKVLGKEHPDTADSYNNIGIVYYDLGYYDKAIEYHKQALEIREEVLGKEHPDTASSYNNIGIVYDDLGNYNKAMEYHKQALEIREETLGKEHPDTAMSYVNIGIIYRNLCNYDKALEYYEKALTIEEEVLGKDHPDTACSYNNIGNVYSDLGNYDKALEYYKQALDIKEKVWGKEHLDTAMSYNNIGVLYDNLGNYDKALEYDKQAWEIREKVLGKEHPDTAGSYFNIGLVYSRLGNYDKALEYYKQALEIREKVLGAEHPDTVRTYRKLGHLYLNIGDNNLASQWFEKAASLGDTNAQINIGYMYESGNGVEQDYSIAAEWFRKAAEGGNSFAQINLGWMYANGCGTEQSYEKAIEWYKKSAEQGNEEANNGVAWTLHLMGKYEDALPWAEKAVAVYPDDSGSIDTLATIFQGLCRYDEALEQFNLCLKLQKEQNDTDESIRETEEKIAALKALMKQQ